MAHTSPFQEDAAAVVGDDEDDVPLIELSTAPEGPSMIRRVLGKVSIEPFIFLYIIGVSLPSIPVENLLIYKVCRYTHFNDTVCQNLLNDKRYLFDKIIVQESLADWKIYIEVMTAAPMLFLAVVVGPWSDKFGRKPPLLVPIVGRIVSGIGILANVYYMQASVVCLILSFLPSALLGSNLVFGIAYSYISDVSKPQSRTVRLAVISFLFSLGESLALITGTKVYESYGIHSTLIASLTCLILSLFVGLFTVKETIFSAASSVHKLREFFRVSMMKECFRTLSRDRQGRKKIYLWYYLVANVIFIIYRGKPSLCSSMQVNLPDFILRNPKDQEAPNTFQNCYIFSKT